MKLHSDTHECCVTFQLQIMLLQLITHTQECCIYDGEGLTRNYFLKQVII